MTCPLSPDIAEAARLLRAGGLVAFPTETVYGLGASAVEPRAVARIFEAKGRPHFDPLIVHIAEPEQLGEVAAEIPEAALQLTERFWPGPLTLVLPKTPTIPDLVTSGLDTVAVRIPDHPVALELLRQAGVPVAAPSANRFGRLSPTSAEHVADQLADRIDFILDGGPCRVGVESTVIELGAPPRLLRPGGLPVEDIESVIGPAAIAADSERAEVRAPTSPGMLPQHYAPSTPLVVVDDVHSIRFDGCGGLLTFQASADFSRFAAVEILSPAGDLTEAATNFFAALRRLDRGNLELIVATRFPEHGLGRALNDRLRRAAHQPTR